MAAEVGGGVNWDPVRIKNPHQNKFDPELHSKQSQWENKKQRVSRALLSQYRDKDTAARKSHTKCWPSETLQNSVLLQVTD